MKLKQLYTSFICYLTLIAFVSIVSIEVSSHTYSSNKKTEVSNNKKNLGPDLNFVFEEERDSNDVFYFALLSPLCFISDFSYKAQAPVNFIHLFTKHKNSLILKLPLFISQRVLRL